MRLVASVRGAIDWFCPDCGQLNSHRWQGYAVRRCPSCGHTFTPGVIFWRGAHNGALTKPTDCDCSLVNVELTGRRAKRDGVNVLTDDPPPPPPGQSD